MFRGKEALNRGNYPEARHNFEEAYTQERNPDALMYLAVAEYRMNNLERAETLIRQAETMGTTDYRYLRLLGYKALILLKRNRDQGLEALGRYVSYYALCDPLTSIGEVEDMARSGKVDLQTLEVLIEEQVSWYENDVELYTSSGVGYYDGKSAFGGPFRFRGGFILR